MLSWKHMGVSCAAWLCFVSAHEARAANPETFVDHWLKRTTKVEADKVQNEEGGPG